MADQFYGLTDTGKERKNNEDTFIAQLSANGRFIIACVIDGVGGYSGGEVAAALAREAILLRLERPAGEVIPIMIDCFNLANQKILAEKAQVKEHDSMACVASLALIDLERNQFHYAHVGDTRLYLLRDNSLIKLSHDQSFVGFLEDSGRLTEQEAMAHPKRNEINKALGFDYNLAKDDDYIETGQSPFLPGDTILLCSDGLTDMVTKSQITEIITQNTSLKDKCQQLVTAANKHGGKDNITVVLVQNNKQVISYQATKPVAEQKKTKSQTVTEDLIKQIIIPEPAPEPMQAPVTKSKSGWTILFAILALAFLGTTVCLYLKNQNPVTIIQQKVPVPVVKSIDPQQIKLQQAIDSLKGNLLVLSDNIYKSPILINSPIQIKRDTLFIKTKGRIELQSDSAYKGAAFDLSPQCKLVMLDSLTIKNFQTGIIGYNNALLLKKVRFVNCVSPIQNLFNVPGDKFISGTVAAFKIDTASVSNTRK